MFKPAVALIDVDACGEVDSVDVDVLGGVDPDVLEDDELAVEVEVENVVEVDEVLVDVDVLGKVVGIEEDGTFGVVVEDDAREVLVEDGEVELTVVVVVATVDSVDDEESCAAFKTNK